MSILLIVSAVPCANKVYLFSVLYPVIVNFTYCQCRALCYYILLIFSAVPSAITFNLFSMMYPVLLHFTYFQCCTQCYQLIGILAGKQKKTAENFRTATLVLTSMFYKVKICTRTSYRITVYFILFLDISSLFKRTVSKDLLPRLSPL